MPSLSYLKELFEKSGLPLSDAQYGQFWRYHNLLRERNKEYDLTRIFNFTNVVQKHYIDSVLAAKRLNWKLPSPLLDIGTGAGLPGIPLKIVCPETEIILSEGRHKRVQFLNEVVDALSLEKVEIYNHKISPSFEKLVQGVITRAVETIPKTLLRIRGLLSPGGHAIFMKGPQCDEEIKEALRVFGHEYHLIQEIPYTIPNTIHKRRLIVFERLDDRLARGVKHSYHNKVISSSSNETFKILKTLLISKGIKKEGQAIVSGEKIINEVLKDFPEICIGVINAASLKENAENRYLGNIREVLNSTIGKGLTQYRLDRTLYDILDVFGTKNDILLVKTPPFLEWQIPDIKEGCTLMIPFQDPENLGSVIRSAAGFGVKDIVLLKEAANPYLPKSIRAGGSAVFRVNFFKGPSIKDLCFISRDAMKRGIPIISLSMEGKDIHNFRFPSKFILLPGLEGAGLPSGELRMQSLSIPIEPAIESLNAAVATAIAIYKWKEACKGQAKIR
ncbi:16S rRNA (guanine(527)-N(7))-methyltransferase RsmG [bacterium]|nr:16S rRNA (guanine(527)-N(7))-methyltransferase RsmG [bacterium]